MVGDDVTRLSVFHLPNSLCPPNESALVRILPPKDPENPKNRMVLLSIVVSAMMPSSEILQPMRKYVIFTATTNVNGQNIHAGNKIHEKIETMYDIIPHLFISTI
jgi:hypothetical protein